MCCSSSAQSSMVRSIIRTVYIDTAANYRLFVFTPNNNDSPTGSKPCLGFETCWHAKNAVGWPTTLTIGISHKPVKIQYLVATCIKRITPGHSDIPCVHRTTGHIPRGRPCGDPTQGARPCQVNAICPMAGYLHRDPTLAGRT